MSYAIISLGGKQYRVSEGERLLVDKVPTAEGKTFHPDVLLVGGNGKTDVSPKVQVTAKVVGSVRGPKIRIGKYRRRTGYRRHTGFRAALSEIEIQSIGAKRAAAAEKKEEPKAETKPKATAKKPAEKKSPARKPAAAKQPESQAKPATPRSGTASGASATEKN
jgi:large subunit ribosomal protein L21